MLQYTNESTRLYFTTTLQNAVQSYSMDEAKILDATPAHPSPPKVFAASPSSHILLSASSHPPTVYLTVSSRYRPPVLLRPQCSASAVVAAAFHPDRANIFVLAFADGTVAVYDATQFVDERGSVAHRSGLARSAHDVEIGYITKVHATVNYAQTTKSEENTPLSLGYDPKTGRVGIGNLPCSITAVSFVPGRKALVMSVGADGKCCVIDFAVPKRQTTNATRIRIIKSWDLGTAGTSLALCCLYAPSHYKGGRSSSRDSRDEKVLAAVGLQDSKVLVYDLDGNLEGQHTFGSASTRVVDVEWTARTVKTRYHRKRFRQAPSRTKRKSLGLLAPGRAVHHKVITSTGIRNNSRLLSPSAISSGSGSLPARGQRSVLSASALDRLGLMSRINAVEPTVISEPGTHKTTLGHMDLFSPVSTAASDTTDYQTAKEDLSSSTSLASTSRQLDREAKRKGIVGTDGLNEQSSQSTIVRTSLAPSIPPRPVPKPGGRLYLRRAQTSGINLGSAQGRSNRHSKNLGIMKNTAQMREPKDKSPERAAGSSANLSTNLHDGAWIDVGPESSSADHESSINRSDRREVTVISRGPHPSEVSNDTVVDWSANSSLPPPPSMNITRTTTMEIDSSAKPPSPTKPKHPAPISFDPAQGSKSDSDTIVHWSSLKKSPRIFDIQSELQDDPKRAPGSMSPPPLPNRAVGIPTIPPLSEVHANATKAPGLPPRNSAPLPQSSVPRPSPMSHSQAIQQSNSHSSPSLTSGNNPDPNHELARMLQQSLHRELKLFHREIMYQFDMQKAWFQHETRDKDIWIAKLEDENGRMRHELSRMRRR